MRPKLKKNDGLCSNGCSRKILCRTICSRCYKKFYYDECGRAKIGSKKTPPLPIGTRRIDNDGYVRVKIGKGREWKDEHRLVIEKKIGRKLESFENVHHKNGVRSDNAESNLELWVRKQPPGQRPKDLIEYAKWILKTYGDIK